MEAVGRLAGGAPDDFNNTLLVIIGYSGMLLGELDQSSDSWAKLDEIRKAGELSATLTRQLLAFSRKQIIKPVPLDLNSIVTNMNEMLRRVIGEDIEIINDLDSSLCAIKADTTHIE